MSTVLTPLSFAPFEKNISMSMLDKFSRCSRKWMYRYKYGLIPKATAEHMSIGSAFHAGVAEFYRNQRIFAANVTANPHKYFLPEFTVGVAKWTEANPGLLSNEDIALVHDMGEYWWANEGQNNVYPKILSVEESIPLEIEYEPFYESGLKKLSMRCTPDLLAQDTNGRIVLVDHKTVGSIAGAKDFLPMDFQLRCYAAAVYDKYGEAPKVDYNMVRRELPPDFKRADGTKPYGLTKTGRKSTRTSFVGDYVCRLPQVFTPEQIAAFKIELSDLVSDLVQAWGQQRFRRSIRKVGIDSCTPTGCEYYGICLRELDGEKPDKLTLSQAYSLDPEYVSVV